jgi:hypothetical protein
MKYITTLIVGLLILPSVSFATPLTQDQANSLIAVVQSSPTTPASAFVPLITNFSNITVPQAESLINVVQQAPGVPANAFVNLLVSFTQEPVIALGGTTVTTTPTETAPTTTLVDNQPAPIQPVAQLPQTLPMKEIRIIKTRMGASWNIEIHPIVDGNPVGKGMQTTLTTQSGTIKHLANLGEEGLTSRGGYADYLFTPTDTETILTATANGITKEIVLR